MSKLSTPPPIKVEIQDMIWQIEEALYNRSLDDLRLTAKCMPAPWQFENVDNALILYPKSTAGMLPRLVVKINEELAISAAYHGWFTAEAEVLREIDVRRMPLSDILRSVENFPICEGVEVKNFAASGEATIAKHEKISYKFVSSTPILPGPSKPELVAIRSKACDIFLRAGKKCAWCTATQLRIQREPRSPNNGKAVLQQDPKNSVTFVQRYPFSRNDHDKLRTPEKNPDKVLISRAQHVITDAKVERKEKRQRDQPVCYFMQSGQLLVPRFKTVVSISTPKLPEHQQTSDGITVTDGGDKTGKMLDFPVQTPSSITASADTSDKLSTTLCTASPTQDSADKSHAINLIPEEDADANKLGTHTRETTRPLEITRKRPRLSDVSEHCSLEKAVMTSGTPIMGERTRTLKITRKRPRLSAMSEHCSLRKAVVTTSGKKRADFRTFLANSGIASRHIDKLEENDIDSDNFSKLRDKDFWQMFNIGTTVRLLDLQKLWKKLSTNKGPDNPSDESASIAESDTTLSVEPSVNENLDTTLPVKPSVNEDLDTTLPVEPSEAPMPSILARGDDRSTKSYLLVDDMPSCSTKHVDAPMPLPKFSLKVQQALKSRTAYEVINLVVDQCANHILNNGDMTNKSAYHKFGKSLVEKYPCLGSTLQHPPWRNINRKLSQKLRALRLLKPRTASCTSTPILADSGGDGFKLTVEESSRQLQNEFVNPDRNWHKILSLFKQLYGHRRSQLTKKGIPLGEILQLFPTLGDIRLVREDFLNLIAPTTIDEIRTNYKRMMHTLDKIFKSSMNDELIKLQKVQLRLVDGRIKSKKKSTISALSVQEAHDIQTSSERSQPPHLVVAKHEDGKIQGWILADSLTISCDEDDTVFDMLVNIIACYYAWDLPYPKEFQLLAFVQHVVIGDKNTQYVSTRLADFFLKFQQSVPAEDLC